MSRAAGRQTTRIEDQAYCLLGLFGINMPLLYGEEGKAFIRLQQEILRVSDDESIFAWRGSGPAPRTCQDVVCGMLAPFAKCFTRSADFEPFILDEQRAEHAMTNKGLGMSIDVWRYIGPEHGKEARPRRYLAPLNCRSKVNNQAIAIIYLGRDFPKLVDILEGAEAELKRAIDTVSLVILEQNVTVKAKLQPKPSQQHIQGDTLRSIQVSIRCRLHEDLDGTFSQGTMLPPLSSSETRLELHDQENRLCHKSDSNSRHDPSPQPKQRYERFTEPLSSEAAMDSKMQRQLRSAEELSAIKLSKPR
ncbi:hypothetical protein F4677DRAFT_231410 [Hypoxylon crocopeplum]|nr:hypothetical protein F4677DRAFT_231410 [Hypoxylon crocopeplum]